MMQVVNLARRQSLHRNALQFNLREKAKKLVLGNSRMVSSSHAKSTDPINCHDLSGSSLGQRSRTG